MAGLMTPRCHPSAHECAAALHFRNLGLRHPTLAQQYHLDTLALCRVALLAQFSKAAGAGQMLNIHDLCVAMNGRSGTLPATARYISCYLLARHGSSKLMPRPFHPRPCGSRRFLRNGFPAPVRKARRAAAKRGLRLRIMFADEARFGRINSPRPCWAPNGTRPQVASQLVREYVYLYGAVTPGTRFVSWPLNWGAELFHGGSMANRNVVAIDRHLSRWIEALRFLAKGFD
jgi:hypothetical protein